MLHNQKSRHYTVPDLWNVNERRESFKMSNLHFIGCNVPTKASDLKLAEIRKYIFVNTCFVYHCQGKWRKSLKGKNTKLIYNTSNIENKSFVHGLLFSFKHYLLVVKHVLYFLKGSHVKLFVSIFIQKCNILIWGIKLFYLNCG